MTITHDVPDATYRARSALSMSTLKPILDSPAKFRHEQLGGRPHKAAYDLGHAFHTLTLGTGTAVAVAPDSGWRTNAAKAIRDEARAAGGAVVTRTELLTASRMRRAARNHPAAAALLGRGGQPEVSIDWEYRGHQFKSRLDLLIVDDDPTIVDLKSTRSAAPGTRRGSFAYDVADLMYHMQAAGYVTAYAAATGITCKYKIIAVEKDAPHLVAVYEMTDDTLAEGMALLDRAVDIYDECLFSGVWPGHPDHELPLDLPYWAVNL